MGIDAYIAFKATGPIELERDLPRGYTVCPASDYIRELSGIDATHEVDTLARYYGIGYERGHWPDLCACLMLLHACPNIDAVYYGGDCGVGIRECTPDDVLDLSRHFMLHGERPYRGK